MDSINKEQPEKNRADVSGEDAVDRIKDIAGSAESCFFCTSSAKPDSSGCRPMAVREVDDVGNLWFLSASDSFKNKEILHDPNVKLYFQGSAHSDFLQLDGIAEITTDKARIKDLWSPLLKNWFTGGLDDPRITAIKVTPLHGYYWDTKHGAAISGIKIVLGAITGRTMDDSIEGRVRMN